MSVYFIVTFFFQIGKTGFFFILITDVIVDFDIFFFVCLFCCFLISFSFIFKHFQSFLMTNYCCFVLCFLLITVSCKPWSFFFFLSPTLSLFFLVCAFFSNFNCHHHFFSTVFIIYLDFFFISSFFWIGKEYSFCLVWFGFGTDKCTSNHDKKSCEIFELLRKCFSIIIVGTAVNWCILSFAENFGNTLQRSDTKWKTFNIILLFVIFL